MMHFWLSRGRGSFGLVDTPGTSLYALLSTEVAYTTHIDRNNGWRAVASPVDPRTAYFTVLRSTSCIQSAVAQLEAYSRGADLVGEFTKCIVDVMVWLCHCAQRHGSSCCAACMWTERVRI
jgi:hypothetical protein